MKGYSKRYSECYVKVNVREGMTMQVYSASDVAEQLNIKTATLRKYSIMMEKAGHTINRNNKGHRYYSDSDVMTIRTIMNAKKNGVTLEEAIQGVLSNKQDSNVTNETNLSNEVHTNDIDELKELLHKQTEIIGKQYEAIHRLTEKIDHQQDTIQQMNNRLQAPDDEPKGIFKRLFNK